MFWNIINAFTDILINVMNACLIEVIKKNCRVYTNTCFMNECEQLVHVLILTSINPVENFHC